MKTPFISALALATAFSALQLSVPSLAQDASPADTAEQSAMETDAQDQSQTWQNPDRIVDIQADDARIRAFSVLIGQSVYDEMLTAREADRADQSASEEMSDEGDPSDGSQASGSETPEETSSQSGDSQDQMTGSANAVSEGLDVQVINVSTLLTPADVLALELLAEQNQQELLPLQSVLDLDEQTRSALEEEGMVPADVVGIQRTQDTLDIFVIPDWLND
ncbi:hypothetical protein [uncultured Devosia sp.]|uniref:hypothetical protein n=1 Tax=uncultured Devosia sp. TaxID=211434 RepID=UPI00262E2DA9|nr:hypothetical protein [uncultured Devosia sp.]